MPLQIKNTDRALLSLLRAGLYEKTELASSLPRLTPSDWSELYDQSKRQTVSGILCNALSFLPDESLPPYDLLLRWVARTHRIETAYERMGSTLASLLDIFESAGLSPVLQKGHDVARFYTRPSLRVCGDIDIYFSDDERREADRIIENRGIMVHRNPDASCGYHWCGIEVEHHSSLIELHNPLTRAVLSRLIAREGRVEVELTPGRLTTVLAPLTDLIMINVHIMKHCLGVGIGLRHFCDYSMAYRALIPFVGTDRYFTTCRELGIARWTAVLHHFIATYLPLSPHDTLFPSVYVSRSLDDMARRIFAMVIDGGNFGLYRRMRSDDHPESTWRRKLRTLSSFMNHSGLSARLAPAEAFWTFTRLLGGQIR